MYKANELKFGNDNRVSVYYDETYYTADEILGDGFGMYQIQMNRDYRNMDFGEFTDELNRLTNRVYPAQYESAIGKYLNLAKQHYTVVELRGHSQGEWATVMVYSDEPFILTPEFKKSLNDWFSGEIYTLVHEQRETYTNADGSKTLDQWESVDSIGAIMAEDETELTELCHDYFTLPKP